MNRKGTLMKRVCWILVAIILTTAGGLTFAADDSRRDTKLNEALSGDLPHRKFMEDSTIVDIGNLLGGIGVVKSDGVHIYGDRFTSNNFKPVVKLENSAPSLNTVVDKSWNAGIKIPIFTLNLDDKQRVELIVADVAGADLPTENMEHIATVKASMTAAEVPAGLSVYYITTVKRALVTKKYYREDSGGGGILWGLFSASGDKKFKDEGASVVPLISVNGTVLQEPPGLHISSATLDDVPEQLPVFLHSETLREAFGGTSVK
jgi:hypothetical protein